MTAQVAKSAEISQFVNEMVKKGAQTAQKEQQQQQKQQQSHSFEILAKTSRKAATALHRQRGKK